jgi:Pvc16 N-terminal domain
MSNALAIAATTATLRSLLARGLGIEHVTVRSLDNARKDITTDHVNLFLYQTLPDGAWRNMDMPRQMKPGETGQPPLPLILYYLLTAYSDDLDDTSSHRLLGQAMSILHDHPLLGAEEISKATEPIANLKDSNLHQQLERVRITLQPLTLEEMSKVWSPFQTQYRLSAAYQVAVVLIESTRPAKAPLPVLSRGQDDQGVSAQGDLIPPFPTIEAITLPTNQTSAQLGDQLIISGHHFDGDDVVMRLTTTRLPAPRDTSVPSADRDDKQMTVHWPNEPANYPAGFYTLSVVITPSGKPDEARVTNEVPVLLAPQITTALPLTVTRANVQNGLGDATINLTCRPEVQPEQRVTLALGDREIIADQHPTQTNSLTFNVKKIGVGTWRVRLRVDGVDSLLVDRSDPKKPKFDESQKVTIQ